MRPALSALIKAYVWKRTAYLPQLDLPSFGKSFRLNSWVYFTIQGMSVKVKKS